MPVRITVGGLVVCVWLSALPLAAEVAGIPRLPRPGSGPRLWLSWFNDHYGPGHNDDDYRTTELALAVRPTWWHARLVTAVDYSIFTDRGPQREAPDPGDEGRIDQFTCSLGWWHELAAEDGVHASLTAGIGVRGHDRLEGAWVQNQWHDLLGVDEVHLPYEDTERWAGTAWGGVSCLRTWSVARVGDFTTRLGFWSEGQYLRTTSGEVDTMLSTSAVVSVGRFTLWGGVRGEDRYGYDFDPTVAAVARHEDGAALVIGLAAGPLVYEGGNYLDSDRGYARISFTHDPAGDHHIDDQRSTLDMQVGALLGHFAVQVQTRWSPTWIKDLIGGRHRVSLLMADYRRGQVPGSVPSGAELYADQITAGIDVEYRLPGRFDWLACYATPALGWRLEEVRAEDDPDRDESHAHRPVAVLDAGLRFDFSGDRLFAYDLGSVLSLGGSVWLPWSDADTDFRGRPVTYQRPHAAVLLGMIGRVGF